MFVICTNFRMQKKTKIVKMNELIMKTQFEKANFFKNKK